MESLFFILQKFYGKVCFVTIEDDTKDIRLRSAYTKHPANYMERILVYLSRILNRIKHKKLINR